MCASVVAATGGIKNCIRRGASRPSADEKSVLIGLGRKNTYFTEHGEETRGVEDEVGRNEKELCGTAVLS